MQPPAPSTTRTFLSAKPKLRNTLILCFSSSQSLESTLLYDSEIYSLSSSCEFNHIIYILSLIIFHVLFVHLRNGMQWEWLSLSKETKQRPQRKLSPQAPFLPCCSFSQDTSSVLWCLVYLTKYVVLKLHAGATKYFSSPSIPVQLE